MKWAIFISENFGVLYCDFNFNFFATFSQRCARLYRPYWSFCLFFVAQFYIMFFSIVEKLNISAIYKSIILIFFSESSFDIYLYNKFDQNPPKNIYVVRYGTLKLKFLFCTKEISIKQPGELQEHHIGEVLQGRSKSKFNIISSYLIVLFFGFRFP